MELSKTITVPNPLAKPRKRRSGISKIDLPDGAEVAYATAVLADKSTTPVFKEFGITSPQGKQNLRDSPAVKALVVQVQEKALDELTTKLGKLSVEFVTDQFIDVYREARECGDRPSALRSLENLGKHLGMFVERRLETHINTILNAPPKEVDEELQRLAKAAGVLLEDVSYERVADGEEAAVVVEDTTPNS